MEKNKRMQFYGGTLGACAPLLVFMCHLLKVACAREKILKKTFAKSSIIWYHMLISLRSVRHRLLSNTVRVLRKS